MSHTRARALARIHKCTSHPSLPPSPTGPQAAAAAAAPAEGEAAGEAGGEEAGGGPAARDLIHCWVLVRGGRGGRDRERNG